jgi:hypothetical protein
MTSKGAKMDARDQEVIEDIQDRIGNGRPPCEPEHFEGTAYKDEDDYYDRYEVDEATGDADSGRGARFTARDSDRAYVITVKRDLDAEARYLMDGDTEVTVEPPAARRGQCEVCHAADVELAAVLSADPDQQVCEACHADPRLPTVSLAAVNDDRPAYVVSRGDLARIAGREVTDSEVARILKAIDYSTAMAAIGDAVWQVCGSPAEPE